MSKTETLEKHLHANGKKHQTMDHKGNIASQITTGANNSAIEKCERSQQVLEKLLKPVYF